MESADGCVEVKGERRDTSACTFIVYMHTSTLSEDTREHITTNTHTRTHRQSFWTTRLGLVVKDILLYAKLYNPKTP